MTRASDQHFTEEAPVWLPPAEEPACDNPAVWREPEQVQRVEEGA